MTRASGMLGGSYGGQIQFATAANGSLASTPSSR